MIQLNFETAEKEPEHVLQWCRSLVASMKDNGIWGIPRSGIVFKIDKAAKRLVLVVGNESNEDFIATKRVFKQIGWDVVSCAEEPV
jgi:hypothetical protein